MGPKVGRFENSGLLCAVGRGKELAVASIALFAPLSILILSLSPSPSPLPPPLLLLLLLLLLLFESRGRIWARHHAQRASQNCPSIQSSCHVFPMPCHHFP